MKLSLRGEYALRALIVLGRPSHDQVLSIQSIAEEQHIPKRFLEQILHELKKAGLLESRRGVAGGYRLKLPPNRITLAEVIRHIEGPLAPVPCVSEHFYAACSCPNEAFCGVRSVMKEVRDVIARILETYTVEDLCQRAITLQSQAAESEDYMI